MQSFAELELMLSFIYACHLFILVNILPNCKRTEAIYKSFATKKVCKMDGTIFVFSHSHLIPEIHTLECRNCMGCVPCSARAITISNNLFIFLEQSSKADNFYKTSFWVLYRLKYA